MKQWLTFADGAVAWTAVLDTNGDQRAELRLSDLVEGAEAARTDPGSTTTTDLRSQRRLLERARAAHQPSCPACVFPVGDTGLEPVTSAV